MDVFVLGKNQFIGESSNGRTADFDSVNLGSNPSSPKLVQNLQFIFQKKY